MAAARKMGADGVAELDVNFDPAVPLRWSADPFKWSITIRMTGMAWRLPDDDPVPTPGGDH